mmetsp:Transcript_17117/g.39449  ORF Transcript_17117/g.39449 Transcript_17117/m.39449 type:complete len:237 (+) Transcript_17117:2049-2759(+)
MSCMCSPRASQCGSLARPNDWSHLSIKVSKWARSADATPWPRVCPRSPTLSCVRWPLPAVTCGSIEPTSRQVWFCPRSSFSHSSKSHGSSVTSLSRSHRTENLAAPGPAAESLPAPLAEAYHGLDSQRLAASGDESSTLTGTGRSEPPPPPPICSKGRGVVAAHGGDQAGLKPFPPRPPPATPGRPVSESSRPGVCRGTITTGMCTSTPSGPSPGAGGRLPGARFGEVVSTMRRPR